MGLHQNLLNEPMEKLSLRKAITVNPSTTVREAIGIMRKEKLGCVIAVDNENKPIGIFNEGGLINLLASEPVKLDDPIERHLAAEWAYVKISDPISTALQAMRLHNQRFVCVVDENEKVVALSGQRGLMEYIADHFPREVLVERVGTKKYPDKKEGA